MPACGGLWCTLPGEPRLLNKYLGEIGEVEGEMAGARVTHGWYWLDDCRGAATCWTLGEVGGYIYIGGRRL